MTATPMTAVLGRRRPSASANPVVAWAAVAFGAILTIVAAAPWCGPAGTLAFVSGAPSSKVSLHRRGRPGLSKVSPRRYEYRPIPPDARAAGDMMEFTVTLSRPLGIRLEDRQPGADGTGVGVEQVATSGSAEALMQEVMRSEPGTKSWIQEGDELLGVNGVPTDGSKNKALEMIKQAETDPITLVFQRSLFGYVKVVFPGGKHITSPRDVSMKRLSEKVGFNSGCTCENGRCGKCWFQDRATGEIYVLPMTSPGTVPSVWREKEEYMKYDSWIPIVLQRADPQLFEQALREDEEYRRKLAEEGG